MADPNDFAAVNVALYQADRKRWAMTERPRSDVQRDAGQIAIGRSTLRWQADRLVIEIDEVTCPWPSRLRGVVHIDPLHVQDRHYALDGGGRHLWRPIAPYARANVRFESPDWRWQGDAYVDSNTGVAPLEQDFRDWTWSRAHLSGKRTAVTYDTWLRHEAQPRAIALEFAASGEARTIEAPGLVELPSSRWGIRRAARSRQERPPSVLRTLEDAPFYARSVVGAQLGQEPAVFMHESLSLERFANRWVQALLPFRMPRWKA